MKRYTVDMENHFNPLQNLSKSSHISWYRRPWGLAFSFGVLFLIVIGISALNEANNLVAENKNIDLSDIKKNFTPGDSSSVSNTDPDPALTLNLDVKSAASFGSPQALITVVEFVDFQCPFCAQAAPTVRSWASNYPQLVRVVFRHFPIASLHPEAVRASEASLCANDQGKFWEYHDELFANQADLSVERLKVLAQKLNLNMKIFNRCVDDRNYRLQVESDIQDGRAAGVTGTPTWFVNNIKLEGAVPPIIWDEIFTRLKSRLQS